MTLLVHISDAGVKLVKFSTFHCLNRRELSTSTTQLGKVSKVWYTGVRLRGPTSWGHLRIQQRRMAFFEEPQCKCLLLHKFDFEEFLFL